LRDSGPDWAGRKFGAYPDDGEVFAWLRRDTPSGRRCVEAQVMDLADDVAYCVHDVEDAVVGGHVDPRHLAGPESSARVAAQAREWYLPDAGEDEVVAALARLRALPAWVGEYDGSHRALAALKDLTSQLIGRFTLAVELATRDRFGPGALTRYRADVVVPRATVVEIGALKAIAAVFVMTSQDRQPVYARQRELLHELADGLLHHAPDALEPAFALAWKEAADDAGRLRAVVDQIASLTDPSAAEWRRRLIPSP
jgi:dGTPase